MNCPKCGEPTVDKMVAGTGYVVHDTKVWVKLKASACKQKHDGEPTLIINQSALIDYSNAVEFVALEVNGFKGGNADALLYKLALNPNVEVVK